MASVVGWWPTQLSRPRRAGCEWLHVDFDDDLAPFYLQACGFQPTPAGFDLIAVIDLDALQRDAAADGRRPVVGALILDPRGRVFVQRRGPDRAFLPNACLS